MTDEKPENICEIMIYPCYTCKLIDGKIKHIDIGKGPLISELRDLLRRRIQRLEETIEREKHDDNNWRYDSERVCREYRGPELNYFFGIIAELKSVLGEEEE